MRKLLPLLMILFSACSPLVTATPKPSPQAVTVSFTTTLRPWIEVLNQCAIDHPEVALITQETSLSDPAFQEADVALWFGKTTQEFSGYAVSLGADEMVVIAGEDINFQNLTQAQLRQLYTDPDSIFHIWTYAEQNELRKIFDQTILKEATLSSEIFLSPNPAAMLEAIQTDSQAIGYIPKSWLTSDVNQISLERDLQAAFGQPIFALTKTEPQGRLRSFLICVQDFAH